MFAGNISMREILCYLNFKLTYDFAFCVYRPQTVINIFFASAGRNATLMDLEK